MVVIGLLILIGAVVSSGSDDEGVSGETTTTTVAPAANPGTCIAVTDGGRYLSTGSCAEGAAPYRVTAVHPLTLGSSDTPDCANPNNDTVLDDSHHYCVELNLVENYCYMQPDGWVASAPYCQMPGSMTVVDIVPGAVDGTVCTTDQGNYVYIFDNPQMAVCVTRY